MADAAVKVSDAARDLGVTPQAVRNLINAGELEADRAPNGHWRVRRHSFDAYLDQRAPRASRSIPQQPARELDLLIESLMRERDTYRTEALALRDAGLQLNAATQELRDAMQSMVRAQQLQSDALTQLLAPRSADDLAR
jgi:excisionase family DNA binding protein